MADIEYLYGNDPTFRSVQDEFGDVEGEDVSHSIQWCSDHKEMAMELRAAADWLEKHSHIDLEADVD